MRATPSGFWAGRCGLASLVCMSVQPASAEPGLIGEQSRATIQISVSVAPRFDYLEKGAASPVRSARAADAALSSNLVRYTVVRMSPDSQERGAADMGRASQLLIVVPD